MNFRKIAAQIIELKKRDDQLRAELSRKGTLANGYHPEMEALHNENAKALKVIMDEIGYPTADKVSEAASTAAWLIIQHAIGQPDFMRKSANLLQIAVDEQKADPQHLAYLTDRIAVFAGKPQRYGTQFDWDEHGTLQPNPFDGLSEVNQRRKAIGLNTLEEQTRLIRARTQRENQRPPEDFTERKRAYNRWRQTVGWIR